MLVVDALMALLIDLVMIYIDITPIYPVTTIISGGGYTNSYPFDPASGENRITDMSNQRPLNSAAPTYWTTF
jgi:hypothetical protein